MFFRLSIRAFVKKKSRLNRKFTHSAVSPPLYKYVGAFITFIVDTALGTSAASMTIIPARSLPFLAVKAFPRV